jgi:uroporphyrinogen decarboxylase
MTNFERMQALLGRKKPDRVPVWSLGFPGFAAVNAGYPIGDAYTNPKKAFESQRWCSAQYDWIFTPVLLYGSMGSWEFGGEIRWPVGEFEQAPMVVRYPAETEAAVEALTVPDVKKAGIMPRVKEFIELALKESTKAEPFYVQAPIGGPFTLAGCICGPEKLCKWVLKKPDVTHHLLRMATDYQIQLAQYWKDCFGTDKIIPITAEPVASNQLISPRHFEQFTLPYVKELHEKLLDMGYKHILCHICGEANANLPFWAKIPMGDPGIVSVGHEIDVLTAAQYFPHDIIMGNIETAVLQTNTYEQVYEISKSIIEKGKQIPAGFAFSPGCESPPKTPPLNMWMMTKAAIDVGQY